MCDCDLADPPEFFDEKIIVANREHKCCECRCLIQKGETYRRSNGKWSGDFESFATCLACAVLWDSVRQLGCCMMFGGLQEAISEITNYWYDERR